MGIKVKCHRCFKEWETNSTKNFTQCPDCFTSVKVQSLTIEEIIANRKKREQEKGGAK